MNWSQLHTVRTSTVYSYDKFMCTVRSSAGKISSCALLEPWCTGTIVFFNKLLERFLYFSVYILRNIFLSWYLHLQFLVVSQNISLSTCYCENGWKQDGIRTIVWGPPFISSPLDAPPPSTPPALPSPTPFLPSPHPPSLTSIDVLFTLFTPHIILIDVNNIRGGGGPETCFVVKFFQYELKIEYI